MMRVEHLQPYAVDPRNSRGRLVDEEESAHRSPHQRDRDRILHSAAFRKLKHKTQVFVAHEGDYYRTRLTHSLEVAQIARSAARTLGLNEDLAEAVALAHDLGHTPFGHAGETALDHLMAPFGGFDHNAQAMRVVTKLEKRYALFDGLNLTWETLEGLVKHNGPLLAEAGSSIDVLPFAIREYAAQNDLELHTRASLEAQIAALADDIAYNNHDFDDGLRAGFFTLDEIIDLPLIGGMIREVDRLYPGLDPTRRSHEALRRMFGAMVEDMLSETTRRVDDVAPKTAEAVRDHPTALAGFSGEIEASFTEIRKFLFQRMYRHFRVNRMMDKAKRAIEDMFPRFLDQPDLLPDEWGRDATAAKGAPPLVGQQVGLIEKARKHVFDRPLRFVHHPVHAEMAIHALEQEFADFGERRFDFAREPGESGRVVAHRSRRVLWRNRSVFHRNPQIPVPAHVSPFPREPDDGQSEAGDRRHVSALSRSARLAARRVGARCDCGQRRAAGADRGGLYCRDDRYLCAGRV